MEGKTCLPQLDTRLIVLGRSKLGKTSLVIKLSVFHYAHLGIRHITVVSPTYYNDNKWKTVEDLILENEEDFTLTVFREMNEKNIRKIRGSLERHKKIGEHTLLIIDDMTREMRQGNNECEKAFQQIVANNRWLLCTVIESAQQIVHIPLEMRVNWDYLITFYPENRKEFSNIYDTCGFGSQKAFDQLLHHCCLQRAYDFLYISRNGPITKHYHNFIPLKITTKR